MCLYFFVLCFLTDRVLWLLLDVRLCLSFFSVVCLQSCKAICFHSVCA